MAIFRIRSSKEETSSLPADNASGFNELNAMEAATELQDGAQGLDSGARPTQSGSSADGPTSCDTGDNDDVGHSPDPSPAETSSSSRSWTDSLRRLVQSKKSNEGAEDEIYDLNERLKFDKLSRHKPGYPQLASFLNSDPNFVIFRRYGYLQNRTLLFFQDVLAELEKELSKLDKADMKQDEKRLQSRKADEKHSKKRSKLIRRINAELKRYHDCIFREVELRSTKRPSDRNHRSVINYLDTKGPLVTKEEAFIYHKDDLISLGGGQENASADEYVEEFLNYLNWGWTKKLFSTQQQRDFTSHPEGAYYSRDKIHQLTKIGGWLALVAFIMASVVLLLKLDSSNIAMVCVLLGCLLLFPPLIETFTQIDRQQVFATTVAFSAVLVVFLNNKQN